MEEHCFEKLFEDSIVIHGTSPVRFSEEATALVYFCESLGVLYIEGHLQTCSSLQELYSTIEDSTGGSLEDGRLFSYVHVVESQANAVRLAISKIDDWFDRCRNNIYALVGQSEDRNSSC